MSDLLAPTPLHIGSFHEYSALCEASTYQSSGAPSVITWVANLAVYVPLVLPFPYVVRRLWWMNGSTLTTSNVDVGVYDADGVKLCSSGSTALAGITTIQYAALRDGVGERPLAPGRYFLGYSCDNTTSRSFGRTDMTAAHLRQAGISQQATALPLPATMTPAAITNALAPWFGVTRTSTGF